MEKGQRIKARPDEPGAQPTGPIKVEGISEKEVPDRTAAQRHAWFRGGGRNHGHQRVDAAPHEGPDRLLLRAGRSTRRDRLRQEAPIAPQPHHLREPGRDVGSQRDRPPESCPSRLEA